MLAYDRLGQGPTLLLLHPLGADRRVWDPVIERLAEQREVIAVDLPGFGESPPLHQTPTPAALAEAVAAELRGIGIDRAHVAGNSLGGWVALEMALAGRANSVTAIAPAGLWPEPLMPKRAVARTLARVALPVLDAVLAAAAGRRVLLAGSVAVPDRVPPRAAAHLVRAYATAPGFSAANEAMRAARFDGLERIQVPVTLVWPEYDRLVGRPRRLPENTRSIALKGCGHIPMWDDPVAVAKVLLEGSGALSAETAS
jgi:pimeloyl-ACP methyl ester carboxylesterase